ncbi:hypothetical protein K491DRAFT_714508 [Lophiostoma macrostomum CBS 122681]|uniref:Uncharacterized protein n=1 Tax=Lophiostoma macrostomum CBS 122681 TaxID=1314788 RepID=A0A6A6TFT0_9PLEO|nr:hypothetical protein K491DRAFT_714508 [Lophiostoma macrostomum CBS 122681]
MTDPNADLKKLCIQLAQNPDTKLLAEDTRHTSWKLFVDCWELIVLESDPDFDLKTSKDLILPIIAKERKTAIRALYAILQRREKVLVDGVEVSRDGISEVNEFRNIVSSYLNIGTGAKRGNMRNFLIRLGVRLQVSNPMVRLMEIPDVPKENMDPKALQYLYDLITAIQDANEGKPGASRPKAVEKEDAKDA